MVEPLVAVVRNSLFPARSTSLASKARSMMGYAQKKKQQNDSSTLTPSFFSPRPRRTKGKEKETGMLCFNRILQCREWAYATKHFMSCPEHGLPYMMQELLPAPDRPICRFQSHRAQFSSRNKYRHIRRHSISVQRRHASQATQTTASVYPSESGQPEASSSTAKFPHRRTITRPIQEVLATPLDRLSLKIAWEIYEAAANSPLFHKLPPGMYLDFASKFCDKVESLYEDDEQNNFRNVRKWSVQFRNMVHLLQDRLPHFPAMNDHLLFRLQCLSVRSKACCADWDAAIEELNTVRDSREGPNPEIALAYQSLYSSIFYFRDALHVLDFLDRHFYHEYFQPPYCSLFRGSSASPSLQRRHPKLLTIFTTIRNPIPLFRQGLKDRSSDWSSLGSILIMAYCENGLARLGFRVWEAMRQSNLELPDLLPLRLVRSLAKIKAFDFADQVFSTVPVDAPEYFSTGMHLFALQGDAQTVLSYYEDKRSEKDSEHCRHMLLYSNAISGKTDKVLQLFDTLYPTDSEGRYIKDIPNVIDYAVAVYGHSRRYDTDGIGFWLDRMAQHNVKPNAHVYSCIIQSYLQIGNLRAIANVLEQMRIAGVQPNVVIYTNIIAALGRHRNTRAAEQIFKRALRDGIRPDQAMVGALLNAYVEAGAWHEVVKLFQSLDANRKGRLQLTISLYNIVLKAYVLMGAPFRVVATLFEKLDSDPRLSPTDISFSLLIQSACDSGYMRAAQDIFREMDRRAQRGAKSLINAYVYTILMAGHLRKGNQDEAMSIYDDMLSRGISPTSVTFNTVLNYYSNDQAASSLRLAYEFMTRVVSQVKETPSIMDEIHVHQSPLQTVYEPVLRGYAAAGDTEGYEQLLEEMLEAGGQMNVSVMTSLLDLYRQKERVESATKVWQHLVDIGLENLEAERLIGEGTASRPDTLCVPFSIYLDTLSRGGEHEEVLRVWREYHEDGFGYNFFNWNRLGAYLVRAGEYEQAFEVLDRVILPYIRQTLEDQHNLISISASTSSLPSSSSSETEMEGKEEFASPFDILNYTSLSFIDSAISSRRPHRSPSRSKLIHKRVHEAANAGIDITNTALASLSSSTSSSSTTSPSHSTSNNNDQYLDPELAGLPEFLRPLKIISKSLSNTPKPHYSLMHFLLVGYQRLKSGQPAVISIDPGSIDDFDMEYSPEEEIQARRMFNAVNERYPDAVRSVLEFEEAERARLGETYEKLYIWNSS